MSQLSKIKTPKTHEIELLNGKKAVVGAITLEVLCWIEEKYGSWEHFQKTVLEKKAIAPVASFVFQMLTNKSDFSDEREFFRNFPIDNINELFIALQGTISASMVEGQEEDDGKKQEIQSQQSTGANT